MRTNFLLLLTVVLVVGAGGCGQPPASRLAAVDAEFTLQTNRIDGQLVFVGLGGEIDGAINPDLVVQAGDTVRIVVTNLDGPPHDLAIPELGASTPMIAGQNQTREVTFDAGEAGVYAYYCTVVGHRQVGMEGRLLVEQPTEQAAELQP